MEKVQRLWRAKRVFTNNQGGWKVSSSKITTQVVTFKADVDLGALFKNTPKGFSEITGVKAASKTPKLRWTPASGWIGDLEGVVKFTLKKGQHTIVLTGSSVDILGTGNYEPALLACVKSGLVSKSVLHEKPTYKNINGLFYVNKPFILKDLSEELHNLPASMRDKIIPYAAETGVPAVVLKLKSPKWTYQFFENGTVLFSGIKDPSERDGPRKLFKEFFTEYGVVPFLVMNLGKPAAIGKPVAKNASAKKAALANRNPLAGTWNALKKPPPGFYIRPGTNGKPRFYMWRRMEQNKTTKEWKNLGPMNLTAVAPKVAKAFANAGHNIPQSTLNAFQTAGYPLPTNVKEAAGSSNARRAPNWNATKPGFYVRPGPGQQPYWFKIPSGLASGRKTVIAAYTKAGRNIPVAVRKIFEIGENVKTNTGAVHKIDMGLNGMIRINGRQATRLTKAQLIAVARNMNIPQANATLNPAQLIKLIQNKSGVKGSGNRTYNLKLNEVYYRFLNNGRVEKTQANKKGFAQRTTRNWSTIPAADQNRIAKAFLPANFHEAYNLQPKNKKYSSLLIYKNSLKPVPVSPSNSNSNSNLGNLANFGAELEAALMNEKHKNAFRALVGNYYRNENANRLVARLSKLPSKNVNKAIKTFAKEAIVKARRNLIEANYKSKVTAPNWLPNNIKNAYKTALLATALQVNNKGKYPTQKAVKAAMQSWINQHVPKVPKAAHTKENVITGETIHVPAWNPPKNPRVNVPKRLSPPRPAKKQKPKAAPKPKGKKYRLNENSNNANNLGSALILAGLNTKEAYTWNNLVHSGVNKKYKNAWARQLSA